MKQATIRLTTELLAEKLNLKPGIEIQGLKYDSFRGSVEFLLMGDELFDKPEAGYPIQVDFEKVIEMPRKSKVALRLNLSREEFSLLEGMKQPEIPKDCHVVRETIQDGSVRIKISGKFYREDTGGAAILMSEWGEEILRLASKKRGEH